jgi:hypothetical protein
VIHHSGAPFSVAVLIPGFDSEWLVQSGSVRPIVMLIGLAALAIIALLVASAAHKRNQGHGARAKDDQLFTSMPLSVSRDDSRHAYEPAHNAFSGLKLPRWLQVGSLVVALGITWFVSQRIGPEGARIANDDSVRVGGVRVGGGDGAREEIADSPEDLDLSPDSSPPFSFRARDWVAAAGGCAGRLEVTKGEPRGWNLTARVHDDQGQLLDSARTRVASLRRGDVVEFRFTRAACERIGAWDVRGARREQ